MTALKVILALLVFIWLILMIPASVIIKYDTDLSLKIRVLFITKCIIPKKQKLPSKKGYSARKYRKKLDALEKKQQKAEKKAAKKAASASQKKEKKKQKSEGEKPKRDLKQTIELIIELVSALLTSFGKHLRIKAERLHIVVASSDAATTAVMYGAISQSLSYLLELLNRVTNFRYRKEEFSLNVDFLSDKPTADVYFEFRLRVWHVFAMLFKTGTAFIKNKIKNAKKAKSEKGKSSESNDTNEKTNTDMNGLKNKLEELENG